MTADNRTNEAIAEEAIKMSWRNYNSDESGTMPTEAEDAKAAVTALEAAGRLAGEPTEAQIEAAAQAVREVDARAGLIADVDLPMYRARSTLEAAAGAAPQAESNSRSRIIDLAEKWADENLGGYLARTSFMQGVRFALEAAPVQPSSTVDEAALAEVIAKAGMDYNLSDRSAESYVCGAPDYRSVFLARAVAEYLTGGTK